jgi:hypothetical protein
MKLPNKLYDWLKWFCMVVIPASVAFYGVLAEALALPYADIVAKIAAGVCAFIGAIIGISTAEYNKAKNQPFVWHDSEIDE